MSYPYMHNHVTKDIRPYDCPKCRFMQEVVKTKSLQLEIKRLERGNELKTQNEIEASINKDCLDGSRLLAKKFYELNNTLQAENKILKECVSVYADSENSYYIERTMIDHNRRKHYIMKNIVQVSKLAQQCLEELGQDENIKEKQ